jgi:hypothetical protein
MNNEVFKHMVCSDMMVNINLVDSIITNKNADKIKIYCEYGIVTNTLIEILLEKYDKYNLSHFVKKINLLSEKIINLLVKNKRIDYIQLIKSKFKHSMINILLEYSILNDFQYGIDFALNESADYILVLDKIRKR